MKKSILVASLLVAGAAIADSTEITCDNVLGVLPVSVPSNKVEIILSVPWVEPGGNSDAVAVSNLVKTAGLSTGKDGFKLDWYDIGNTNFNFFVLDERNGTNYWDEASGENRINPDECAIRQGEALMLTIPVIENPPLTNTFYIVGQVGTNVTVTTTIPGATVTDGGSKTNATWTLLAPPNASMSALPLNELFATENIEGVINQKDEIVTDSYGVQVLRYVRTSEVVEGGLYTSGNARWTVEARINGNANVPAGRGFWYKRCAPTDLKIKWSPPSVNN